MNRLLKRPSHAEPALFSEDAERGLIGAMLLKPADIDTVASLVCESDFALYGKLFSLLVAMHDQGELRGRDGDVHILLERVKEHGLLDSIGGRKSLAEIFISCDPNNAVFYAKQVRKYAKRRRLLSACAQAIESLNVSTPNDIAIAENLQAELDAIASQRDIEFKFLAPAMRETLAGLRLPVKPMIYSGLRKFDDLVGGFAGGELVAISAKTSGGKSAFALQVADYNCQKNRPVLFITIEMAIREEIFRIWSNWTGIPVGTFRTRSLSTQQLETIERETSDCKDLPLAFRHMPFAKWRDIQIAAKTFHARHGLSLLVLDYVGLVQKSDYRMTKQDSTSEITSGLKHLAGQLDCPVFALVQLNREASRQNSAELHNMADSAAVERDADIVINIHQPDSNSRSTARELHMLKFRNGEKMDIAGFRFLGEQMRFEEDGGEEWQP